MGRTEASMAEQRALEVRRAGRLSIERIRLLAASLAILRTRRQSDARRAQVTRLDLPTELVKGGRWVSPHTLTTGTDGPAQLCPKPPPQRYTSPLAATTTFGEAGLRFRTWEAAHRNESSQNVRPHLVGLQGATLAITEV
jgi:hypothetical protein